MSESSKPALAVFGLCLLILACMSEMHAQPPQTSSQRLAQGELSAAQEYRKQLKTKHEGLVWYAWYGGHWYREQGEVTPADEVFFDNYEVRSPVVTQLLRDAGYSGGHPDNDVERWQQIGRVWEFLREHIRDANEDELSPLNRWPSLTEYATFYQNEGQLAWHACFSKAHLFGCLLGRMIERDRVAIVSAHHTEAGAPPTASHVFVAVYVANEWYYVDPAAVLTQDFPQFVSRRSVGVPAMNSVDYEHPFKMLVLPGSRLRRVPLLAGDTHLQQADPTEDQVVGQGRAQTGPVTQWTSWDARYDRTMSRLSALRQDTELRPLAASLASRLTAMRRVLLKAQQIIPEPGVRSETDVRRELKQMHQQFARLADFRGRGPRDSSEPEREIGTQGPLPEEVRQVLDAANGLRTLGLEILRVCAERQTQTKGEPKAR